MSQNINLSNFKSLEAQKRIQTNNEILDVDQNLVVDAVSKKRQTFSTIVEKIHESTNGDKKAGWLGVQQSRVITRWDCRCWCDGDGVSTVTQSTINIQQHSGKLGRNIQIVKKIGTGASLNQQF